jgi:hypothetical protein
VRTAVACVLAIAAVVEYGAAFRSVLPHVAGPHTKLEVPLSRGLAEVSSVLPLLTSAEGEAVPPRVFTGSNIFRMGSLPNVLGVEMIRGGGIALLSARHEWLDVGYLGPDHMNQLGVDLVLAQGKCAAPSRLGYEAVEVGLGVCVQRNPTPRPRYELVGHYRRVERGQELLHRLRRQPADPIGVLADTDERLPTPTAEAPGHVSVRRYQPGDVELDVRTDSDALLLARQSWAPGWTASIDGEPGRIYPAAGLFFAIPISAGDHHVMLDYQPPGMTTGLALGSCWVLLAFYTTHRALRNRRS